MSRLCGGSDIFATVERIILDEALFNKLKRKNDVR